MARGVDSGLLSEHVLPATVARPASVLRTDQRKSERDKTVRRKLGLLLGSGYLLPEREGGVLPQGDRQQQKTHRQRHGTPLVRHKVGDVIVLILAMRFYFSTSYVRE